MAATRANGLNAEPGWRWPCVATLNCWRSKSRPPTMALISPVRGSMATSATVGSSRRSRIAASRVVGRPLHPRVERRVDAQTAAEGDLGPELAHQLPDHVAHVVRRDVALDRDRRAASAAAVRRRPPRPACACTKPSSTMLSSTSCRRSPRPVGVRKGSSSLGCRMRPASSAAWATVRSSALAGRSRSAPPSRCRRRPARSRSC